MRPAMDADETASQRRALGGEKQNAPEPISDPYAAIANSPAAWFATCARILTKDQQLLVPKPNGYQLKILRAYEWCLAHEVPCRVLALKPRQKGSSTVSAAIVYHHCRRFRARAVQIGDRYKTSDNLFAITGRFAQYDDFPWDSLWEVTQSTGTLTLNGQEWSRIDKDTAENPRAGRSGTLQALHVSEAAHFPTGGVKSADKTMLAILNSLADVPRSVAIVETTANGAGGWFYENWQGAATLEEFASGRRGNGWIKVFSPWFEFEDSTVALSMGGEGDIAATLDDREKAGRALFGWTARQIAWRRLTLAQKCGGRPDLFDQEYPEDEQSAFLSSGRPRFPVGDASRGMSRLRLLSGRVRPRLGFLHRQGGAEVVKAGDSVAWEPHEAGWALVFEEPREGCSYLVWCDTATGREQTSDAKDPDRHSVLVLRHGYQDEDGQLHNPMLVARVRPPCFDDWHVLEQKVIALSLYYGRALTGVEVPMGLTLLEGLRRAGMPLFKRKPLDLAGNPTEKLGFQTNSATKPLVIASLSKLIDEGGLDLFDPHAIAELETFVVHEDGREAAVSGKHDDDVMALAMGVHNLRAATRYNASGLKHRLPPDFNDWRPAGAPARAQRISKP